MVTSGDPAEVRAIHERLYGEAASLTAADVGAAIGRAEDYVRHVWRLLGFPDPEDRLVFFPADVELLRIQSQAAAFFGTESVVHMTRAIGAATRNIIEATLALLPGSFGDLTDRPAEERDPIRSAAEELLDQLIRALPALLAHQVHESTLFMRAGTGTPGIERTLAVAFCDLVGSTSMANAAPTATALAITAFETHAADAIAQRSGRLVKFVGDEVMFATGDLEHAHDIAVELLQWVADHDHLSFARAGIAQGQVISRDGDLYGTTVNLASRLVAHAEQDTIVIADDLGDTTLNVDGFRDDVRVQISRRL
jgi:adenylate cyclase